MSDDHLINVIIHIQKNLDFYPKVVSDLFIVTAWKRGIESWRYISGEPTPFELDGKKYMLNEETQEFEELEI